jgi:hypothetical protein
VGVAFSVLCDAHACSLGDQVQLQVGVSDPDKPEALVRRVMAQQDRRQTVLSGNGQITANCGKSRFQRRLRVEPLQSLFWV